MSNPKYHYIFWDNDGVLVDTEPYYLQANREAMAKASISLSEEQFATTSMHEGRSIFDLVHEQQKTAEYLNELKIWRNQRYAELLEQEELILSGVKEALEELHGKIKMAIVTSSQRTHFDIIHRRTGLLPFFDFCLTREDYTNSKPSAEPYLLALQRTAKEPHQALVIEDSPRGLKAAKAAGIDCCAIPGHHTSASDFMTADRIPTIIAAIPELLL